MGDKMEISTEISLTDIIEDWFHENRFGDIWGGRPSTPNVWMVRDTQSLTGESELVEIDNLVVTFMKVDGVDE